MIYYRYSMNTTETQMGDDLNIQQLGIELSQKTKKELIQRDLSRIPADKLFKLALENEDKLRALVPIQEFGGELLGFDFETNPSFWFNPEG